MSSALLFQHIVALTIQVFCAPYEFQDFFPICGFFSTPFFWFCISFLISELFSLVVLQLIVLLQNNCFKLCQNIYGSPFLWSCSVVFCCGLLVLLCFLTFIFFISFSPAYLLINWIFLTMYPGHNHLPILPGPLSLL